MPAERESFAPLEGVRVLDLTNVLAGPLCTHQLAHFGAEIIKIEQPGGGDLARNLGLDPALNDAGMGVSFLAQNVGKKSITLNLKHDRGRELFLRLVEDADVVVENFRPGVMERLGLGYETLKGTRPTLIYCAISGFGQQGPWADRPAYDQIIQGVSGIMSVTGDSESAPLRAGYPVADSTGGLTAAFAIAAALNARPRGAFLDVSMLDSAIATLGWAVSNYLIGRVAPAPHGNDNYTSAPSGAFQARGGLINIAANKEEQWRTLVAVLGCPALAEDPRYRTRQDRIRNRDTLKARLERELARETPAVWTERLNGAGVPAGEVLTVPDILGHPQVAARDLIAQYQNVPGVGRDVRAVRTGVRLNGKSLSVSAPPPELGAQNCEIYGALGLDATALDALRRKGVI